MVHLKVIPSILVIHAQNYKYLFRKKTSHVDKGISVVSLIILHFPFVITRIGNSLCW